MMKYEAGDTLYYVCPFIFTIDTVHIDFAYRENDTIYYIESTGAYLREENLFRSLEAAKFNAMNRLNDFYYKKLQEIQTRI